MDENTEPAPIEPEPNALPKVVPDPDVLIAKFDVVEAQLAQVQTMDEADRLAAVGKSIT